MKTWSLIIILLQVDYIEDDGWDFCSALWQLNLQGNQVLLHLGLFVLVSIFITTVVLHSFVLLHHHLESRHQNPPWYNPSSELIKHVHINIIN